MQKDHNFLLKKLIKSNEKSVTIILVYSMAVLHLLFIYAQKVVEIVESDRVAIPKSPKFSLKIKKVRCLPKISYNSHFLLETL